MDRQVNGNFNQSRLGESVDYLKYFTRLYRPRTIFLTNFPDEPDWHNMAPQPTNVLPPGTEDVMNKLPCVQKRLEIWCLSLFPSPLTRLVQSHVRGLVAELPIYVQQVRNLRPCWTEAASSNGEYELTFSSTPQHQLSLQRLKTMIGQSLELLDFVREKQKQSDEDQEIHALYASMYILSNDSLAPHAPHRRVKLVRLAREFEDILAKLGFGPRAAHPCPPLSLLPERARPHLPELRCFFDKFSLQLSSRYIHRYPEAEDVPYKEDFSTKPVCGSMGAVFKVREKCTGQIFAMKQFEHLRREQMEQISREIGVLELLSHRNVVQLVEAFQVHDEPRTVSIVMAPWAPLTLQRFLDCSEKKRTKTSPWFVPRDAGGGGGGGPSDRCIFRLMREMADGLEFLHSHNIKHKDIKPENILLFDVHDAKAVIPIITDVGISKVYTSRQQPTKYTDSTMPYLAPEQLAHDESSLKSDIWQLGCCLAMLLAVSMGGTAAMDELWESFNKEPDRSCNISREIHWFMKALKGILSDALSSDEEEEEGEDHAFAYRVVCSMLNIDASSRCDVTWVQAELEKLA